MANEISGIINQIRRELGNVSSNFFNFRNEAKNNDDSLFNIVKDAGNAIKNNKSIIEDVKEDVSDLSKKQTENISKVSNVERNLNQVINNQKDISKKLTQFDDSLTDFRKNVLNRFSNLNAVIDNIVLMQRRSGQQQQPQAQTFQIPGSEYNKRSGFGLTDALAYGIARRAEGLALAGATGAAGTATGTGTSILGKALKLGTAGAVGVAGTAGAAALLGSPGQAKASTTPISPPTTPPSTTPPPSTSTTPTPSTSGSSEGQYKPTSIPNRGWHPSFNMLKAQKIDPTLVEAVKAGAINAFGDPNDPNTRYEVRINNAHRPGNVGSKHASRKAIDLQIYDRVEKKFVGGHGSNIMMNAYGNPHTYKIYQALARGGYQHLYSKYGEKVARRFSHGGNFFARQGIIGGASHYGAPGGYDHMHYSLDEKGRQGTIVGGAGPKIQAHLRKYGIEPAGPMGDILQWRSPYKTQQPQTQTEGSQTPPPQSSYERVSVPKSRQRRIDSLDNNKDFTNILKRIYAKHNVSREDVYGIIQGESNFNPRLISPGGGYGGLFQMGRGTLYGKQAWGRSYSSQEIIRLSPVQQALMYEKLLDEHKRRGWSGGREGLPLIQAAPASLSRNIKPNQDLGSVFPKYGVGQQYWRANPGWRSKQGPITKKSISDYYYSRNRVNPLPKEKSQEKPQEQPQEPKPQPVQNEVPKRPSRTTRSITPEPSKVKTTKPETSEQPKPEISEQPKPETSKSEQKKKNKQDIKRYEYLENLFINKDDGSLKNKEMLENIIKSLPENIRREYYFNKKNYGDRDARTELLAKISNDKALYDKVLPRTLKPVKASFMPVPDLSLSNLFYKQKQSPNEKVPEQSRPKNNNISNLIEINKEKARIRFEERNVLYNLRKQNFDPYYMDGAEEEPTPETPTPETPKPVDKPTEPPKPKDDGFRYYGDDQNKIKTLEERLRSVFPYVFSSRKDDEKKLEELKKGSFTKQELEETLANGMEDPPQLSNPTISNRNKAYPTVKDGFGNGNIPYT